MSILEKFTVIDLIRTRSASVATVTGNIQTAAELHYAPYIQVLINTKDKQFAIRVCDKDVPNSLPFSKPEGEQKYQIKISSAAITDLIRKTANWSVEENWNIPGIYFADESALIYDVNAAYKSSPKGGWTVKHQKEAAAAAALAGTAVPDKAEEADS